MKKSILPLFLIFFSVAVHAQDVSRQRAEIARIEKEISLIDTQLSANRKAQKSNMAELSLLKKKVANREAIISQLDAAIKEYDRQILLKQSEIARTSRELDTMRSRFGKLVRESYKIRDSKVWFVYILASDGINEGYRRWKYLQALSTSLRDKTSELKEKHAALEQAKANLDQLRIDASKEREKQNKEYEQLKAAQKETDKVIKSLAGKEKELKKKMAAKRKETEKLNKEIERIIAEAVRKAKEEQQRAASKKAVAADYKLSGEFASNKGRLPWPVDGGVVVEKFGQHNHPVFKNIKMPYNNGVNISAPAGSRVKAVFDGVVKQILVIPGYNQCVLVQHGSYFTFYCKLKEVSVKAGQNVRTGGVIGVADVEDGNSLLHFELWKGTEKQNPELWLRK